VPARANLATERPPERVLKQETTLLASDGVVANACDFTNCAYNKLVLRATKCTVTQLPGSKKRSLLNPGNLSSGLTCLFDENQMNPRI
jgi:hypothetical protein